MADDGDQIAMPTSLDPEYAETAFGIMEGDAFHEAGQDFSGWCFRNRLHSGHCIIQSDPRAQSRSAASSKIIAKYQHDPTPTRRRPSRRTSTPSDQPRSGTVSPVTRVAGD